MAISDQWKIQNLTAGTPAATFASLGLEALKIKRSSDGSGSATFREKVSNLSSAPLFSWMDRVAILYNGSPWFVGYVTPPKASGTYQSQSHAFEIQNSWWLLAHRIIFRQKWFIGLAYYARVILGQGDLDFDAGLYSKLSADMVIKEVLNYAITALHAKIQIGYVTPGPTVPYTERVSVMCGEAITMMLKWIGSAVVIVDDTTYLAGELVPTINIYARSECAAKSMHITDSRVQGIPNIFAINDTQAPVVEITYEQKNTEDNETATNYIIDKYPPDQDTAQLGAVIHIIELSGSSSMWEKNNVRVQQIPVDPDGVEGDATSAKTALISWILKHRPEFKGLTPGNLKYVDDSYEAALDPEEQTDINGNDLEAVILPDDLPNELMPGSKIAPWQAKPATEGGGGSTNPGDSYKHVAQATIHAEISYDFTAGGITRTELKQAWNLFGAGDNFPVWVKIKATDMSTQLYKQLTNATLPEEVPVGIAQYIWRSLNQLNYDGSLNLKGYDAIGYFSMKHTLCLLGSENPAWATMNAQIKSIEEIAETREVNIQIGPPSHLSPQDILELLRASRVAVPSNKLNERATGKNSRTPEIDRTDESAATDGAFHADTTPLEPWSPIDNDDGTIKLNPDTKVYDVDYNELTIYQLENNWTPVVGQMLYLSTRFKSDGTPNADDGPSCRLLQGAIDVLDGDYPQQLNTDDPANPFVEYSYRKIIQFVAKTDTRQAALIMMLADNSTIIKVIQLARDTFYLRGSNVANQSILGVDYTVAPQNAA